MEPPGAEHGVVAMRIGSLLLCHVEEADRGLVFTRARSDSTSCRNPDTVRAPDAAFVARARVDEIGIPRGYWPGPPDLAIEVASPNDRHSDVGGKALHWLEAGARAVVVVDPPRRTAIVYRGARDIHALGADEELDLGEVVPGWSPRVGSFFVD